VRHTHTHTRARAYARTHQGTCVASAQRYLTVRSAHGASMNARGPRAQRAAAPAHAAFSALVSNCAVSTSSPPCSTIARATTPSTSPSLSRRLRPVSTNRMPVHTHTRARAREQIMPKIKHTRLHNSRPLKIGSRVTLRRTCRAALSASLVGRSSAASAVRSCALNAARRLYTSARSVTCASAVVAVAVAVVARAVVVALVVDDRTARVRDVTVLLAPARVCASCCVP
jgi:hypothetical protein